MLTAYYRVLLPKILKADPFNKENWRMPSFFRHFAKVC